jgi:hypothetical protein
MLTALPHISHCNIYFTIRPLQKSGVYNICGYSYIQGALLISYVLKVVGFYIV